MKMYYFCLHEIILPPMRSLLLYICAFFLTIPIYAQAPSTQERISALADDATFSQALVGICARTADGREIANINAEKMFVPASNMKLISTGAALHKFGTDFQYETSLAYSGEISEGVLYGNLYIIGGGDPTTGSKDSIATAIETLEFLKTNGSDEAMADEAAKIAALDKHREKFIEVMDDDLNTADGIAAIFELVSEINLDVKDGASKSFAEEALKRIRELTEVLGIFGGEDEEEGLGDDIQALIDERQAARKEKNWARADEIRDQLAAMGITLKDTPQGVQVIRN
jgi:ribosome assembly protein YihI (activator of Der GTPase)